MKLSCKPNHIMMGGKIKVELEYDTAPSSMVMILWTDTTTNYSFNNSMVHNVQPTIGYIPGNNYALWFSSGFNYRKFSFELEIPTDYFDNVTDSVSYLTFEAGGQSVQVVIQKDDPEWGFVTVWDRNQIAIPVSTTLYPFSYDVYYLDGSNWTKQNITPLTTSYTVNVPQKPGSNNEYKVSVVPTTIDGYPVFRKLNYLPGADAQLLRVEKWGGIEWQTMEYMFYGYGSLQSVSDYAPYMRSVNSTQAMFFNCTEFNKDLNDWDTSSVTDMRNMFYNAKIFNGNIGSWDVSNVVNMSEMFSRTDDFNQNIGNWKTNSLERMYGMFSNTKSFNQDISNWNVSKVYDMAMLFIFSNAFDQNLGQWQLRDTNGTPSLVEAFTSSVMSCYNYNKTLEGWYNDPGTAHGVTLGANGISYTTSAHDGLINDKGWNIMFDYYSPGNCSGP